MDTCKALAALAAQRWRSAVTDERSSTSALFYLSHSTKRSWDRWWFQDSAWASC